MARTLRYSAHGSEGELHPHRASLLDTASGRGEPQRMKKAGLLKEFSALDAALEWVKNHAKEIVIGTVVVIGGVIYVVSTGGAGAPVLTLLPAVM